MTPIVGGKPGHQPARTFFAEARNGHPPAVALRADALMQRLDGGDAGEDEPGSESILKPGGNRILRLRIGGEQFLHPHQRRQLALDQTGVASRAAVDALRIGLDVHRGQFLLRIEVIGVVFFAEGFERGEGGRRPYCLGQGAQRQAQQPGQRMAAVPAGGHRQGLLDPGQRGARDALIKAGFEIAIRCDLEVEALQPAAVEGEVVTPDFASGFHG